MAKNVTITLVAGHPVALRWVGHLEDTFIPAANAAMDGSGLVLAWDTQFSGSLAKVGEELEITSEGLAEIGLVLSVFDPAKLAVQNISYYTPFASVDVHAVLDVVEDLHQTDLSFQKPWSENGLTYLGGGVGTSDYVLLTKTPVSDMADLKGLRLGVAGPSINWLDGTGAVGVSGNLTTYAT